MEQRNWMLMIVKFQQEMETYPQVWIAREQEVLRVSVLARVVDAY